MKTNAAGVAVCSCGAELEVRCTGGCAEPDYVIVEETAICTFPDCTDPVAARKPGAKGPPPKKCQKHLEVQRGYRDKYFAKKKAAVQ